MTDELARSATDTPSFVPALSTTSDRPTGPAMPARPAATPDRPDKSEPAATPEQHNARLVFGLERAPHGSRRPLCRLRSGRRKPQHADIGADDARDRQLQVWPRYRVLARSASREGRADRGDDQPGSPGARDRPHRGTGAAVARDWAGAERPAGSPTIDANATADCRRQPIPGRTVFGRATQGQQGAGLGTGRRLTCGTSGKLHRALRVHRVPRKRRQSPAR